MTALRTLPTVLLGGAGTSPRQTRKRSPEEITRLACSPTAGMQAFRAASRPTHSTHDPRHRELPSNSCKPGTG